MFSHHNHFHIFFICSFFLSSPCILGETGLISARQKQLRWRGISFGPCTVCYRAEFLAQMAARVCADWVRAILPALVSAWRHSFLIKWRTVNSSVTCSELQVCKQNTVNFCSCCPSEMVTSNTVFIFLLFIFQIILTSIVILEEQSCFTFWYLSSDVSTVLHQHGKANCLYVKIYLTLNMILILRQRAPGAYPSV